MNDVRKNALPNSKNNIKKVFSSSGSLLKNFPEINLIFIITAIWVAMSFLSPYWNTWDNIKALLMSFSIDGIVVIGMTILLIVGGFDISVGSVMALTMVIAGKLFTLGINPWISSLIAIMVAGCIGAIIGILVTRVGLNFLITTLAIMVIAGGASLYITQGQIISLFDLPAKFKYIGQGRLFEVPIVIFIFLIFVVISDFMLRKSLALRNVIYTGSDERSATLSGINTKKVILLVCILTSALAGFSGILYIAKLGQASSVFAPGLGITTISAAVLGGASLNGGRGSILGSILGLSFLSLISGTMTMLGVSAYSQELVRGLILLLAVSLDHLRQRKIR